MTAYYVEPDSHGTRIDVWLCSQISTLSRARAQQWIRDGHVLLNGVPCKPSTTLTGDERVDVHPPPETQPTTLEPEAIPLAMLYEDDDLLVVDKPAGLVVHPAPGHEGGTLVNALLHRGQPLADGGHSLRPGIVHRLDRDTSGVIVVAKTLSAMRSLRAQFKDRTVRKEYLALVRGCPQPPTGAIETLIGRNPGNRKKMSARVDQGREAYSEYEVLEAGDKASLVRVIILTGRTHQIRVHMAHIGHPILGDQQYGKARVVPGQEPVPRQMLHAASLAFQHPTTKQDVEFIAPIPADMREWIRKARETASG